MKVYNFLLVSLCLFYVVAMISCAGQYPPVLYPTTTKPSCESNDILSKKVEIMREELGKNGYTRLQEEKYGSLRNEKTDEYEISLNARTAYFIVGIPDEYCHDLNLAVYDKYGNDITLKDMSDKSVGLYGVIVIAALSGHYTVKVTMRDCRSLSCCYAIGVYSIPLNSENGEVGNSGEENSGNCEEDSLQEVKELLKVFSDTMIKNLNANGITLRIISTKFDSLSEGEYKDYTVRLEKDKRYLFDVVSDSNCYDIGLAVYDDSNKDVTLAKTNIGQGYYAGAVVPVVTGTYTVRITMRNCKTSHCCFGVQIGIAEGN